MSALKQLSEQWMQAKAAEAAATARRREIEDALAEMLDVPETLDGTKTHKLDGLAIKVTGRMNRSVNADLLQELAHEAGIHDQLASLFRWKPEINMSVWKHADPSITEQLAPAITTKPGRPSFKIEEK